MKSPKRLVASVFFIAILGIASAAATDAPRGASGCSGCHAIKAGIEGALPRLNGRNPADVIAAMQAFASGQRPSTVMGRIAKGFSDVEIKAIADWLADQP